MFIDFIKCIILFVNILIVIIDLLKEFLVFIRMLWYSYTNLLEAFYAIITILLSWCNRPLRIRLTLLYLYLCSSRFVYYL